MELKRVIKVAERENQNSKRKALELTNELKAARDTQSVVQMHQKKQDTEASKRRMSLEEELQQKHEENRSLEDKLAKTEFDCKLKEVTKREFSKKFRRKLYFKKIY